MIATWREVVEFARASVPDGGVLRVGQRPRSLASALAGDAWSPSWTPTPAAVLAYPITRRMDQAGERPGERGRGCSTPPAAPDLRTRWRRFCHDGRRLRRHGLRPDAAGRAAAAGVFRRVLRPDRLLMAELTLQGRFRQVPEVLWFRRQSDTASVDRQRSTLVLAGDEPPGFARRRGCSTRRCCGGSTRDRDAAPVRAVQGGVDRDAAALPGHLRRGATSARPRRRTPSARGIDNVIWAKKITKHHYHHAVYNTLVGGRAVWGRCRRGFRRAVYEVLMLTHRLGLRRPRETPRA